ncbi:MAG: hypothetical protein A2Y23_15370 [Clostridiales bacterium GWB2_37_7]|nr:MAG: hypothetical protein A2Y23_15370 [Clostridiales bacterium GWB2_37_7]
MSGIVYNDNYEDVEIRDNTTLFRITRPSYSDPVNLLNGQGSFYSQGRYNYLQQATSYCSDNIFICISEVLFHMYEISQRKLKNNDMRGFRTESNKRLELVVFNTNKIENIAYIDSDEGRQNYKLNPTTITHSDTIYSELRDASNNVRLNKRVGMITPSARHSVGFVIVLFGDHSASVKNIDFKFPIKLSLLSEDLKMTTDNSLFSPFKIRINQTIGMFEFDTKYFKKNYNYLKPIPTSSTGKISFSRFFYEKNYPKAAIL